MSFIMTTTILVGNGLGMAINPQHFTLKAGIDLVAKNLSDEEKNIISLGSGRIPIEENNLEDHHKILSACQTLIKHNDQLGILNQTKVEKFSKTYSNFIYQVAKHFYNYQFDDHKIKTHFNTFINNLICFMNQQDRCHIATLNYDKLLYQALIERNILHGYYGSLVDGIVDLGFKPENMIPTYNDFGWYMHLHGSPSFITDTDGITKKLKASEMPSDIKNTESQHKHIVLTHTKLKPSIIANSFILDAYFDYFIKALSDSDTVLLFGYSGNDTHINLEFKKILSKTNRLQKILIVQWGGNKGGHKIKTCNDWEATLYPLKYSKKIIELKNLENILDYNFE